MSSASIKEHIQKYGWRCQYVFDAEREKENFAYTIGLEESFGHPEIMIFGLKRAAMHSLLQEVVDAVGGGSAFMPDQRYSEILSGGLPGHVQAIERQCLSRVRRYSNGLLPTPISNLRDVMAR